MASHQSFVISSRWHCLAPLADVASGMRGPRGDAGSVPQSSHGVLKFFPLPPLSAPRPRPFLSFSYLCVVRPRVPSPPLGSGVGVPS